MVRLRARGSRWRLTPYGTQNKLDTGIFLPGQIQTDSNGCLRHHDGPDMMHSADMTRDFQCQHMYFPFSVRNDPDPRSEYSAFQLSLGTPNWSLSR